MDHLLWADVAGNDIDLFGDLYLLLWTRVLGPVLVVTLPMVSGCAYSIASQRRHGRATFSLRAMLGTTALAAVCLAVFLSGSGWALLALVLCLAVLPWLLFARR